MLDVPENIFEHDDGIVHHHADGEHQCQHGEDVDRVAEGVQDGKCADDGDGDGDGGDKRRTHVAQKQIDREDRSGREQRREQAHQGQAREDVVRGRDPVGDRLERVVDKRAEIFALELSVAGRWKLFVGFRESKIRVLCVPIAP